MGDESTATKNTRAETSAKRGSQSNPTAEPEEVRYSLDELREDARNLLGVSAHAVAGALHDSERKTFTLDQAKKAVNTFLGRPVEGADEEFHASPEADA